MADPKTNHPGSSHFLRGYLLIFIAVFFWGGSASLAKYLFTTRFDTVIISQTRTTLSFVLLAGYFLIADRSIFRIQWSDLYRFASIGVIGVAVTNYAYYFTVSESTVAAAILTQNTAPALVTLYAVGISKEERFDGIKVLALVLALAGCYLAVSGGSQKNLSLKGWSLLSGVTSAVCYAFMLLAGKSILRKYSVWTMLVYAFGFAGVFWLFFNPPWAIAAKGYTWGDWGVLWLFAVVSILIPHGVFSVSLKLLEASTVAIGTTLEPVIAIVVAYFALGESLNSVQLLGGASVIGALVLLQLNQRRIIRRTIGHGD